MFEELRGLPPKEPKAVETSGKKRGCKHFGCGFLIVAVALILGLIIMGPTLLGLFNTSAWNNFVSNLTAEMDQSEIAPNAVTEQDIINFENNLNTNIYNNNLPLFDDNHMLILGNISKENTMIIDTLTLTNKDLTCFLNAFAATGWLADFDEFFENNALNFLQTEFTVNENQILTASIVTSIKSEYVKDLASSINITKLPEYFYIKIDCDIDLINDYNIIASNLTINKTVATEDKLLTTIFKTNSTTVQDFCKIPVTFLIEELNRFISYWNANVEFSNNLINVKFN